AAFEKISAATEWLISEVRHRAQSSKQAAEWYRSLSTQKANQWGPATHRALEETIDVVERTISRQTESKKAKPIQLAEYYAGLLCMMTGLLPLRGASNPEIISDTVRKRLDRGALFVRAAEEYEARFPTTTVRKPSLSSMKPTLDSWFAPAPSST